MKTHKSFRYRVYPTEAQIKRLTAWENALRFLWNLALEQRLIGLAKPLCDRRFPTAFDQINELTQLRSLLPWLADVPRDVCAQLLVELDKAWQRCFKKISQALRWKKLGRDQISFCESHSKSWGLRGHLIHFPKIGNLRVVQHRPLEGTPKICTLKRDGDQWFVTIVCEVEAANPTPRTEPVVAIDRGVINVTADSDGRLIESPRFYEASIKRLARAQRNVARKQKGSKNQTKAKLRVAGLQRKTRRQREHFIHQLSHSYSKSHGTVVIEKLQIGNMVRANRGLSRGILDAGWGMLAQQLSYKLAREGGVLGEVPAHYSSQTCAVCGHVSSLNRKTQSRFECEGCGVCEHADVNAAKVLKSRWKPSAQLAEGSCRIRTPRRSKKVASQLQGSVQLTQGWDNVYRSASGCP